MPTTVVSSFIRYCKESSWTISINIETKIPLIEVGFVFVLYYDLCVENWKKNLKNMKKCNKSKQNILIDFFENHEISFLSNVTLYRQSRLEESYRTKIEKI